MIQVKNNDPKATIVAFRKTLHLTSPQFRSLAKSGIKTIKELSDKTSHYANLEKELRLTNHKRKITQVEHAMDLEAKSRKKGAPRKKLPTNYLIITTPRVEFSTSSGNSSLS